MIGLRFAHLPWRAPRREGGEIQLNSRRLYILPTRDGLVFAALLAALLIGGAVFLLAARGAEDPVLRTTAFLSLLSVIFALVLVNRSFSASIFTAITRPNRPMAVIFPLVMLAAVVAVAAEPARALLRFSAIGFPEAGLAALVGLVTLVLLEGLKAVGALRRPPRGEA